MLRVQVVGAADVYPVSYTHLTERSRVISATITLADMADYGAFNAVWDQWVADGFEPVRSVTEGHLAVPEYKVKISLIAALR